MLDDIEKILVSEQELSDINARLGAQITKDFKGKNLLVLGILKGCVFFMTDLVRHIDLPLSIDFMSVSSYGSGTESTGRVKITKDIDIDLDGYDVLILDWMMPKLDGIALCKRLRAEEYQGKILLLTARDSVEDKVAGLNEGADDYLVKPFEMAELLARLHALVRRQGSYKQEDYVCKGVTLAVKDYTVGYKNKKIQLRPREFKLMELLLINAGQILPRELLLERVWGIDGDVTENNLDVHIRSLRLKLASIGAESLIKTVRGVGYMLEVEDV